MSFHITNILALKAPASINEVSMFKLTIKEHFQIDYSSSKAKIHIAGPNQICTLFGTPSKNIKSLKHQIPGNYSIGLLKHDQLTQEPKIL